MAPTLPQFNPTRLRSYIFRLPLFTRMIIVLITVFGILELQSAWDVKKWGALIPNEMGFGTMYRLNTYPIVHLNFLHALLNILALTPLLERFEAEHGTLLTIAMFAGRISINFPRWCVLPSGEDNFEEQHSRTGGKVRSETFMENPEKLVAKHALSIWVFLLLGFESIKAYKANPYFAISTYRIPTWTTPLAPLIFVAALVPNTSVLGHLCGLAIGYLYGLGYLKLLAPPEKVLRWIEGKLNLLGRLPHYVSIDQNTYGRYGVLPTTTAPSSMAGVGEGSVPMTYMASTQRLGP
ncbi:putative rhomboid protease [Toensbergia leucococca]|nr:putative rhomboid protease [Toensbergia leucococca]